MKYILGIELCSTRIKAVLTNEKGEVLSQGSYEWKNSLVDGLWSYSLDEAQRGLQSSYKELVTNYGKPIEKLDAIGIYAMMHGYLAFDKEDKLLAPFRTWRNTNTGEAVEKLSKLFNFNVPMRWSVSQYYQSFLDGLDHVKEVDFLTTLAGYIHYLLTGKKVIGADDASGMFPLNGNDYDGAMLVKFNALIGKDFKKLLPKVMLAGENAGTLTEEGAKYLDPTGTLKAGAIFCPPEGDAGTGMVATNSVTAHGGFYKTEFIGQRATSAVLNAPVTVMENAGEGGAWGIALLAGYALTNGVSLSEYLDKIFAIPRKRRLRQTKKKKPNAGFSSIIIKRICVLKDLPRRLNNA